MAKLISEAKSLLVNSDKRKEFADELHWILKKSGSYKKIIFIYTLIGLAGVLLSFVSGIASKYLIDAVSAEKQSVLFAAFAVFAFVGLFSLAFSALSQRLQTKLNIKVGNELRADIFRSIIGAEWQSISVYRPGDLLNRLNSDANAVISFLLDGLPGLAIKLFRFLGAFFIIFYYDKVLALIAFLGAPAVAFSSRYLVGKMRSYNKKAKEASAEIMSFSEEVTQNLTFIKAFSLGSLFRDRYGKLQKKQQDILLEYNKFSVLANTVMGLCGIIVGLGAYAWGIYRLWNGRITYGTMVLFVQLAGGLTSAFSALLSLVPQTISASTSAGRLMEIHDIPHENDPCTEEISMLPPVVSLRDVSFAYYDGSPVLNSVSLDIAPGDIIALIGASGGGKTTLFRLLLGLIKPQSGDAVLIAPTGEIALGAATRGYFAYVSQENVLFTGTVAENLRFVAPQATDGQIVSVLKTACADFVLDLPQGIDTEVLPRSGGFSSGQLQRIAIARALISDAPIVLFDEITSALDKETEQKIIQNIFQSELHRTVILTTHRDSMLDVCKSVYRVQNGSVIRVK